MAPHDEDEDETTTFKAAPITAVQRHAQPHVLELVTGPVPQRSFVLDKPEMVFGRSAQQADLVIESNQLSRKHMALKLVDGQLYCHDLDSRNGVFLNGVKIRSAILRHGDQIQLGDVVLVYYEGR